MLDIRAIAYVDPASEVPFAPVTLTVLIENFADETGLISGSFRIYNGSTGLLIFQSDIAPLELSKGESADVSSLTEFSPPAPADNTYFVLFDGIASNALVPDGISIQLGSFYFDVEPAPLGPIPAGHAVTHEDTGIDEISVAGLSGLLADPQTPILHHLEHELGGSDEISVAGLSGELADDQPPKAHSNAAHSVTFEDQANKGIAGGYCGIPNPLDTTLPLRADGTPARPTGYFKESDMEYAFNAPMPFYLSLIASGGSLATAGEPNHPFILDLYSSVSANSGAAVVSFFSGGGAQLGLRLAGSETTDFIIKPRILAGTTLRMGFCDTITASDQVDGCYLEMTQIGGVDGTLVGKTANNSTRSTTGTSHVLITNTWYRLRVSLDPTAARVDFYLYDAAGALLWTDNLTTNIPTAAGRETSHGLIATNSGTTAVSLIDIDYINLSINRPLIR